MKKILVRYGELTLKGNNKNVFIAKLIQNIKFKLKPYKEKVEYIKDYNSLTLAVDESVLDEVIEILKNIFGIYSISLVDVVEKDEKRILAKTLEIAKSFTPSSFKVEVERKDKGFAMSSVDLKTSIAGNILRNTDHLKVDVHKPDNKITVVIKSDGAYIFTARINAAKGLPVGVSGKGISLLSGGIDSPVASYLTLKRGMQVDFLHFMTPPHTTPEALDKVFTLAKKLERFNMSNFSLYVCDFSMILRELMHIKEESYRITLMRRIFMRIANALAQEINAKAIITGESLGQVASQTIESINVINETSKLPILRPVLTYDKEEIIEIAKKIDTFETSILPFDDVCSLYVPKKPVTKPKSFVAQEQEKDLMLDEMIDYCLKNNIQKFIYRDGELIEKQEEKN
ncbi:tRNA uracil 4-sulfurtransferase ThiI [Spiroplasma culicicola]|uniref:Probable tRNA sulfurtransferase n=1 Tax=Spiroplasma culicicola AES-1 TaxID=1276246 RepID=W6A8K8_9MOLU|nr:tRNA uracil 4-sulfurtransferase ThiI [Spiroplasma culicicola]AHI53220.1 thiamine biosynthesis protein ThiI [Spiroplasma culicicola AES-1]